MNTMISERTKRILLVSGFILSVFVIALLLYLAFFRPKPTPAPEETTPEAVAPGLGLPSAQEGAPSFAEEEFAEEVGLPQADEVARGGVTQTTELTTGPIFNPTLSGDGSKIHFYDQTDGKFYTIGTDGKIAALSDKKFRSVEKATWNNNAEKAILEFPDGSNVVYDFGAEKQVTLPKHWEGFDFSPVSDELAAKSIALDPNNRWIVLANADGSNVKSIQGLGENADDIEINWSPNDQVVAFADTAESVGSVDRKMIVPLGKEHENFKGLTVEGLNFSSTWSPDGKQLLYSVSGSYSNYRPLLWIVDASASSMAKNRRSLGINTWVEKCTWASPSTIYCAVPQTLPENAGLQPSLFGDIPDALYKIDVTTGTSSLIAIPDNEQTIKQLFVTKDESSLYYTNARTGKLEYLKLK